MASVTSDLSYKNIISSFFVNNKLIAHRDERIDNGFRFVVENVPVKNLSQKLHDVIRSKVGSVEMTFIRKWNECKVKYKEQFEQHYEKWIHTDLKLPSSIMSENCRQRGSTQSKKKFGELSDRQKNRRVDDLGTSEIGQALLAAVKSAKHANQTDLHYVLNLLYKHREKASKIRDLLQAEKSKNKKIKRNSAATITTEK